MPFVEVPYCNLLTTDAELYNKSRFPHKHWVYQECVGDVERVEICQLIKYYKDIPAPEGASIPSLSVADIDRARQEVERQIETTGVAEISLPHDPTTCSVCSGASISSLYSTPILPEGSHPDNHGTFGVHHPSNTCDYCRAEEEDERVLDALSDDPEMDESEPE